MERRGRQDMQKEKEEGKHRGGLFQAEVLSLQGICTRQCQTEGDRHTGWPLPDVQHTGEEQTQYRSMSQVD